MKNMPNMPPIISTWIRFAPATLRERSSRSGSSGLAARAWRATNAPSSASATAPRPSVCSEPQP